MWVCGLITDVSDVYAAPVCRVEDLKMEALYFSETLASTCKTHDVFASEDANRHLHRREKFRSHEVVSFLFDLPFFVSSFSLPHVWKSKKRMM